MFDAVPNDATGYVAAAYVFFFALVLIYIAIIGAKLERIGRELSELIEQIEPTVESDGDQADRPGGEVVG